MLFSVSCKSTSFKQLNATLTPLVLNQNKSKTKRLLHLGLAIIKSLKN